MRPAGSPEICTSLSGLSACPHPRHRSEDERFAVLLSAQDIAELCAAGFYFMVSLGITIVRKTAMCNKLRLKMILYRLKTHFFGAPHRSQ